MVWLQTTYQDFNYGGAKSLTSGIEASNQILPYGKGARMEKIDLSKALAFALENAGKATRGDPTGNASIISFLHEVGKRSLGSQRRSSQQQQQLSSSSQQLPMVHVHIKEISKGAQKLNQIIKACSNSLSFRKGRYSIHCGEELMEGAIELEQSLRLLVDIQQASSEYITKKPRKNRIKLLEETDDEEEEEEDEAQIRNHRKIKEVAKADIEMRLLALNYPEDKKNKHRKQTRSFQETEPKPQKGRIPNVVAKLMGLGEFPQDVKDNKNKNDAHIKSTENLTRGRAMQASENLDEIKAQRNSMSLDLVVHKETQKAPTSGASYKAKPQKNDRENDDSYRRKRNKVSHKKDGEPTMKNVIRKSSAPAENKHKVVSMSQQKPLHKLSFEKKLSFQNSGGSEEEKSIKKEKLKKERAEANGVMTNRSPKLLSSLDIVTKLRLTDKPQPMRKSFSHVEVAQKKKKEGEVHKPEIQEKKDQEISNPNGGLCKVMKQPENQKHVSKESDGKHTQLLRSYYNDSNKMKAQEAEKCISSSKASGVEVQSSNRNVVQHIREIKDDSILLIAAERVPCQDPSENVSLYE